MIQYWINDGSWQGFLTLIGWITVWQWSLTDTWTVMKWDHDRSPTRWKTWLQEITYSSKYLTHRCARGWSFTRTLQPLIRGAVIVHWQTKITQGIERSPTKLTHHYGRVIAHWHRTPVCVDIDRWTTHPSGKFRIYILYSTWWNTCKITRSVALHRLVIKWRSVALDIYIIYILSTCFHPGKSCAVGTLV